MLRISYQFNGEYENREIGLNYDRANFYEQMEVNRRASGFVEEYWSVEHCFSFVLVPGT